MESNLATVDPNTTATARRILERWDTHPGGWTLADRLSDHAPDVAAEVHRIMKEELLAEEREDDPNVLFWS
jgi:hypothetical protein